MTVKFGVQMGGGGDKAKIKPTHHNPIQLVYIKHIHTVQNIPKNYRCSYVLIY